MSIIERLYPSADSETVLSHYRCDADFLYKLGLRQGNLRRKSRTPKITYATQAHELEAREACGWLMESSFSVQQSALGELDRAFRNWWANTQHFHRPNWSKAGQNEGFYISDLEIEASLTGGAHLGQSGRCA